MTGIAYGVGVGPGDPELMTLKAVRLIRENEIIAVPGKVAKESVAYRIAVQAVPELAEKTLVPLDMPMLTDLELLRKKHEENAAIIEGYLAKGQNVVFLTLGDIAIYSTFTYLQTFLEADGFKTQLINGIPSFCAAAARLNIPLAEWQEELHIVPASHKKTMDMSHDGNYVLMKSGSHMSEVKEQLLASGRQAMAVENCGMENEKVYRCIEEIPEDAGYFSLIIAKE